MKDSETIDMSRLVVKTGTKTSYDIVYKTSFEALTAEVGELYPDKPAMCVITDSNVDPLYAEEVVVKVHVEGNKSQGFPASGFDLEGA